MKKNNQGTIARIVLVSIILFLTSGCIVVGGYSSERGWFVWPGTIVLFLVGALLILLFKRRK
jgi:protein-S-isoprenylcysteine O-methyltransferase Ste14